MSRGAIDHPLGIQPPHEWWEVQGGHASATQFQEWLAMTKPKDKKRSKFNANVGYREDLGHSLRSSLEANQERLLRFLGYQPWDGKEMPPTGLWFRYEGKEFKLTTKRGNTVHYKPDFQIVEDGKYRLIETKGDLDRRSKQKLTLMAQTYPEIPIELVTYDELEAKKAEALFAARRKRNMVLDIPGWEHRKGDT